MIILDRLGIEMVVVKISGDWLVYSVGWRLITVANVASSGTTDSFLKLAHVSHTRHVHTVTASALYILLVKVYTEYMESLSEKVLPASLAGWLAYIKV